MNIAFTYAFVLGIMMSLLVFVGCMLGKRSFVLAGMVFSAIVASPVTTFTRGTAGAIYASDMVALTLLVCWVLPSTKSFICHFAPRWYKWLFWLMMAALFSVVFIAPWFSGGLVEAGLLGHVRSPIPGIPLVFLMAAFRFIRIILYLVYFSYSARMLMDEKTHRLVYKLIVLAISILAVCQILTFLGIADFGLYLRGFEWQMAHMLGHAKSAAGRLYLLGIFVTLILFYRPVLTPLYFAALAAMSMALLFSGSRAGFIGMLMGLIILGIRLRPSGKLLVAIILALLPLAFFALEKVDPGRIESFVMAVKNPSSNPRWAIWEWIIPYIGTHLHIWFTGVGFSNFRYGLVTEYIALEKAHAHNDFLTCFTEVGFLGFILFCSYVYSLGKSVLGRIKYVTGESRWEVVCISAIFIGYLVTGLFESTLYFSVGLMPMQRIVVVLFGTTTAWWVQSDYIAESAQESTSELSYEDYEDNIAQEEYI